MHRVILRIEHMKWGDMSGKAAIVSIRTDESVKEQAKELFNDMGLDLSTAINMFLRQSIASNGMPFTPSRESRESVEARYEAEHHMGKRFENVDDLMNELRNA